MTIEKLNITLAPRSGLVIDAEYEFFSKIQNKINELTDMINLFGEQQTKINEHFSERLDRLKKCLDIFLEIGDKK